MKPILGATLNGFKTYRYFEGNDFLRAWIATPLTVNIFDRSKGTIEALFSKHLWTDDGLASQASIKGWKASCKIKLLQFTLYKKETIAHNKPLLRFLMILFSIKKEYSSPKYRDSKWGASKFYQGNYEDIFKDKEPLDGVYWFRKNINIKNSQYRIPFKN